jgi:4-hydroxybutyrate dehydrogenase
MRFNVEPATSHYARLAALYGLPVRELGERAAAERSIAEVEAMIERLGIKSGLRHHGVPRESLPGLSAKAIDDSCHKTNIRPCTREDLLRLYEESW